MHLSTTTQNNIAALIAKRVHENTTGYSAVATKVGQASHPDAAVVAITSKGQTTCTAKVAVHHDRLVYLSATGTHVSRPIRWSNADRIICALLPLEND